MTFQLSTKRFADRYLEAVDYAWNLEGISLKLEEWGARQNMYPEDIAAVRAYLQGKGIL